MPPTRNGNGNGLRGLVAAGLIALAGCSWAPGQEPPASDDSGGWLSGGDARSAPAPAGTEASGIVALAEQMLGVPYRWGGRTPAGFDCSGLVQYTFERAGYRVPRTSAQQHRAASPVPIGEAQPGDLVFFAESGRVSHELCNQFNLFRFKSSGHHTQERPLGRLHIFRFEKSV